jgi:hypothetical protein
MSEQSAQHAHFATLVASRAVDKGHAPLQETTGDEKTPHFDVPSTSPRLVRHRVRRAI